MKENEVYSLHPKKPTNPHAAGSNAYVPPTQPQQQKPPVHQPLTPASAPAEPAPHQQPEPPKIDEKEQARIAQEQAIALTRSRIEAIHNAQAMPQGANQSIPQDNSQAVLPAPEVIQPTHQLEAPSSAQKYGEYTLPGATPQPPKPAPAPSPKPAATPKKKRKKALNAVKDKIKKVNTSKIKQKAKTQISKAKKITNKVKESHKQAPQIIKQARPAWKRFAPVVSLVLVVTLILNNQLVYGQISYYVTPGNRIETPTIVEAEAGNKAPPGNRIIIPKINVDVPINYKVKTYDEESIQRGLEDGIVHYVNTGMPGEVGNSVLLGHNTNNFWNSGKYKTAFVLLDRLKEGDTLEVHHKKTRYVYEVYEKKIIEPDDFSVVTQKVTEPIITLITCHPPGTSWQRLIIQAKQISPEPAKSDTTKGNDLPETIEGNVPGAAPGPLEDIFGRFF